MGKKPKVFLLVFGKEAIGNQVMNTFRVWKALVKPFYKKGLQSNTVLRMPFYNQGINHQA